MMWTLSLDPKSWEVRRAVVYDQFENTVTTASTKRRPGDGSFMGLLTY